MKDGVPPLLLDDHLKNFKQAIRDGKTRDPTYGLQKTMIAGTGKQRSNTFGRLSYTIVKSGHISLVRVGFLRIATNLLALQIVDFLKVLIFYVVVFML